MKLQTFRHFLFHSDIIDGNTISTLLLKRRQMVESSKKNNHSNFVFVCVYILIGDVHLLKAPLRSFKSEALDDTSV